MTATEEPILFRLDRLDNILKHLEELRGSVRTPRSSYASTTTSSTEGHGSSIISATDFSPKSMEKHCRPIDDVILETEHKGTLIERLVRVEDQVLKLEAEVEAEKKREEEQSTPAKKAHERWLKQFVKSCVKSNKNKSKSKSNLS